MKKSKIYVIGFIMLVLIATSVLGASKSDEVRANLSSSSEELKAGQEVVVTLKFDQYNKISKGLYAFKATLEYDKTIFKELEERDFVTKNNWEGLKYNKETGELVAIKKAGSKVEEDILQVALQVKEEVEPAKTDIVIRDVTTSEGKQDIIMEDARTQIDIIKEQTEQPDKPDKITSSKYRIGGGYIERILPETTLAEFKRNVTTEQEMTFIDESGNELKENDVIATGTKLKVGTTLNYTLIVIGDVDKDAQITINDLAEVKLHLIDYKLLTGIKEKAADVDDDGEITINDIAQIKLILIDLLQLK